MDYHPVTKQITDLLTQAGIAFQTFEHEPVRTSEEAAKIRPGYTLREGAKAIIARVKSIEKGKHLAMFVMPAHLRLDTAKVREHLALSQVRFASEAEVLDSTGGVLPGGVPPFGNLFGLPVYVDPGLFDNERIVFNAGDRRFSVAMASHDYKTLVIPVVAPLASGMS